MEYMNDISNQDFSFLLSKTNDTEAIILKKMYKLASVMNSKWVHYTRPSQAFFSPCLFS